MWRVFTARYALSPCIKQTRFVFKGLQKQCNRGERAYQVLGHKLITSLRTGDDVSVTGMNTAAAE
jgi:hypothetical protein